MGWTLLLRFAGVLQSWGTDSRFEIRRTEMIPTKSGIVGLLAAALGRKRNEEIQDLAGLKIGVRTDRPGTLLSDFHTVKKDKKISYITTRYYLCDALFLVGIGSDCKEQLEELAEAIRSPAFPLYLGRRSCVPEFPVFLDLVELPLKKALETWPCLESTTQAPKYFHIFLEGETEGMLRTKMDEPVSFDFHHRRYQKRDVRELTVPNPAWKSKDDSSGSIEKNPETTLSETEHDALSAVEEMR